MATRMTRYLVDERGRRRAILLDMKEYSSLLRRLEELEDTLALDEAVRTASGFRDYRDVRNELQHEGRV